jgi:anti-sigma factor RsiW
MTETCDHFALLLNADLDGELDAAQSAALAQHVATCEECTALRDQLGKLSAGLRSDLPYHRAPDLLRARLTRRRRLAIPAIALAGALAASLAFLLLPGADNEVLTAHLRALQPGHLTDVTSNDQHNVKPWFDGRLDYAPPVKDLAAQGFPLTGGRLDYLAGRPVAALVYRRQQHVIDVFVWPHANAQPRMARPEKGYQAVSWDEEGFAFTAISDLNAAELQQFAAAFKAAR